MILNRFGTTLLILLITAPFFTLQTQTEISGKILSLDGQTIPNVYISVEEVGNSDIFSEHEDIQTDEEGTYRLMFDTPGYYDIRIDALFHQTVTIPVLVTDQEAMEMDIRLSPLRYRDDTWFHLPHHTKWIRAKGNFNNYSFSSGYEFTLNDDGAITATIPADRDTITVQVRGLSNRPAPLPGADEYRRISGSSFEGLYYTDLPKDSLTLRYHPDEEWPYRMYPYGPESPNSMPVTAFITLPEERDRLWIKPLIWSHRVFNRIRFQQPDEQDMIPDNEVRATILRRGFPVDSHFNEILDDIDNYLNRSDLHHEQRVALLISYVHVLRHMDQAASFMYNSTGEEIEIFFDPEIIAMIPDVVSPAHPMWARVSSLPSYLFKTAGKSEEFENYLLAMSADQSDDFVVRDALLALIEHRANQYDSYREMPEFEVIERRYGRSNLYRMALQTYEKHSAL